MKKITIFFIVVILAIFQVTLLDYFKIYNIKPDLLLIAVVTVSLSFRLKLALSLSVFIGFLKDIFNINTFGLNTLLFPIWTFLIIKLSRKLTLENNFIRALLVVLVIILNNISIRFINLIFGHAIPIGIFLRVTCLESLYTLGVSFLCFRFLCKYA